MNFLALRSSRPGSRSRRRPYLTIAERARDESLRDLAAEYGVGHGTVRAIARRPAPARLAVVAAGYATRPQRARTGVVLAGYPPVRCGSGRPRLSPPCAPVMVAHAAQGR